MNDSDKPATKADLELLRTDMSKLRDELVEVVRDSETRLLKAFYGFVETVQARF